VRRGCLDWRVHADSGGTTPEGGICHVDQGVADEAVPDGQNRGTDEFDDVIVRHVVVQRYVHSTRNTHSSAQGPSVQQGVEFRLAPGHRVKLSHKQRKNDTDRRISSPERLPTEIDLARPHGRRLGRHQTIRICRCP